MQKKIYNLEKKSNQIRNQILEMIVSAGKGHIGGALSCTDIMVALFYGGILRYDPLRPDWSERDRFILSKGHSCTVLYSVLADRGYFQKSELSKYGTNGCMLGGHPDRGIPGVEADTGSLGHGLGIAAGLALSAKMDKSDFITVVLLGDGESCEGSVWEAAMFAARHSLRNGVAIVDNNGQCATDLLENCIKHPLKDKWKAFGWDVTVLNGHSFEEILATFNVIHSRKSERPLAVIANTVKGKGISYMEGKIDWHHRVPKGQEVEIARRELKWNL